MASFPNVYTHRKVAETASKPCTICYKPSSSVMVTAENKDFFYVCPSHLKDKQFALPIVDEAKKKRELAAEVEAVKKEFEEKQRKKKEKEKEKEKEGEKEKDAKDVEKKDDKKSDEKKKPEESTAATPEEEPRVFALQKTFFQQRIDKKRAAEIAKRQRERLQNPNLFPQVPKGLP